MTHLRLAFAHICLCLALPSFGLGVVFEELNTVPVKAPYSIEYGGSFQVNETAVSETYALVVPDDKYSSVSWTSMPWMYLAFLIFWSAFFAAWIFHWFRERKEALSFKLHRVITIVMAWIVIALLLNFLSWVLVRTTSQPDFLYYAALAVNSSFEGVFCVCLLLIGASWGVSRPSIEERQFVVIACGCLALVAILIASTLIISDLESLKWVLTLFSYIFISMSAIRMFTINMTQSLYEIPESPAANDPNTLRYLMFRRFRVVVPVFMLCSAGLHIMSVLLESWLIYLGHESIKLVMLVSVGFTFRLGPNNIYYVAARGEPDKIEGIPMTAHSAPLGLPVAVSVALRECRCIVCSTVLGFVPVPGSFCTQVECSSCHHVGTYDNGLLPNDNTPLAAPLPSAPPMFEELNPPSYVECNPHTA